MWTVVVRDSQGSEICRLPLKGRLVVGRTPNCEIVLPSTAISRQHARIELFKERPVFVDFGSSNGSTLNGQPLTKPTLVDEKSRVEIAGFQILFERAGAAAAPPAPVAAPPPPPSPPPASKAEADELELVPMGPVPAVSKPAMTVPAGMNFLELPRVPTPLESAPKSRASTDSAVDLLDQQLAGIRTYRDGNTDSEKARLAQLDVEWKQVLVAMQQLKDKVGKHPKIQHFTFSRDEQEVSVKVEDSSNRGYSYYVLSRRHPTGKYDSLDAVWLCELGSEERNYKQPKEAMADLVRRLAPRLA